MLWNALSRGSPAVHVIACLSATPLVTPFQPIIFLTENSPGFNNYYQKKKSLLMLSQSRSSDVIAYLPHLTPAAKG